jgi:hypothetical protein
MAAVHICQVSAMIRPMIIKGDQFSHVFLSRDSMCLINSKYRDFSAYLRVRVGQWSDLFFSSFRVFLLQVVSNNVERCVRSEVITLIKCRAPDFVSFRVPDGEFANITGYPIG